MNLGKNSPLTSAEPKPPYLICGLIAMVTLVGCGAFMWARKDLSSTSVAAKVDAKAYAQIIELNRIYSMPAAQEDPSTYRKLPNERVASKRGPAKIAQ